MQNAISLITAIFCIGTLASSCSTSTLKPIDKESIKLAQFTELQEDETVATISTNYGDLHLRFFESEMPDLAKRFEDLFEQGYFTKSNMTASVIVESANEDNFDGFTIEPTRKILYKLKREAAEPSVNLIHIPGSISAEVDNNGKLTGKFFVVTSREVPESVISEIESCGYPEQIVEKFKTVGGYPELWLRSPVFAQIYEGEDILDNVNDNSESGEKIVIESISFSTYGDLDDQK